MSTKNEQALLQLEEQRRKVIELAELQIQLRLALNVYLQKTGMTLNAFAQAIDAGWAQIAKVAQGTGAVSASETLEAICREIDASDLQTSIEESAVGLNSRIVSLAINDPDVINLAFDLKKLHEAWRGRIKAKQLAEFFAPHQDVFQGVISGTRSVYDKLEDEEVYVHLTDILEDPDLDNKIEEAIAQHTRHKAAKVERFKSFLEQMPLEQRIDQARELDMPTQSLHEILSGKMSIAYIEQSTRKIQRWLKRQEQNELAEAVIEIDQETDDDTEKPRTEPADPPRESAPAHDFEPVPEPEPSDNCKDCEHAGTNGQPVPEAPLKPTARELLEAFSGETSPLGVRFVLTPDSFQDIDLDPGESFMQWAVGALEMARLALNFASQIKNDRLRAEIQARLAPQVEELTLTINAFSVKYPNRISSLNESQRQTWASQTKTTNPPKR